MLFRIENFNWLFDLRVLKASVLFASLLVAGCQTETASRLVPQTEYVVMPIYNKQTYAFQFGAQLPEDKQILAIPLKKPVIFKPRQIEITDDPLTLVGHKPETVAEFFGKPTRKREDNDSQIWQYYSKNCAMDVFFYDESESNKAFIVEYVDVRVMNTRSKSSCVNHFLGDNAVALKKLDKIQYSLEQASSL